MPEIKIDKRAAAGGGGGAPTDVEYLVLTVDGDLSAERRFVPGAVLNATDAGANGDYTLAVRSEVYVVSVTGAGTITNITYESDTTPSNERVTGFESDDDDVTITVRVFVHGDVHQPSWVRATPTGGAASTVNKSDTSEWTEVDSNGRVFDVTIQMTDAATTGTILVETSDGASHTINYTRSLDPPDILTAVFDTHPDTTGGDPLVQDAQTETTSQDGTQQVRITGTCDSHATRLWVKSGGVSSSEQGPYTISGGTFDVLANVRSSGSTGAQAATVECAVGTGGTRGASLATSNTVTISHTQPSLSLISITYPGTQAALKNDQNARIQVADSNDDAGDTVSWNDNGTSDFDDTGTMAIADSEAEVDAGTYTPTTWNSGDKWVERQGGSYRDTTNVRVTKTRTAKNGTNSTLNISVEIANVAPTIDITNNGEGSGSPKRFRSRATGGDKTYTITITSDQNLKSAPTLSRDSADDGPALGSFSGSDKSWTATITIEENDTKNVASASHDFESLSCQNNAEISQTTINSGSAYMVSGFEQRDIALAQFDEFEPIGTMVSNRDNANKLDAEYVGIGDAVYQDAWDNSTKYPGTRKFTIVDSGGSYDADGDYVRCLDPDIYDNLAYTIRIEEDA